MNIEISLFNNVWMNNGIENFFNILKVVQNNSFDIDLEENKLIIEIKNKEGFKDALVNAIKNYRNNLIVKEKDKKTNEMKEIKKPHIIIQEGKKTGGKVYFKEIIYNENTIKDVIEEIFSLIEKINYINEDKRKVCTVCGKSFYKKYKNLQQAAFPFVTKIKSLSGIRSYKDGHSYSFKEYYDEFCPVCYLIGITEWLDSGLIYFTIPRVNSIILLPKLENLKALRVFKKSYRGLLNNNDRYKNIRMDIKSNKTEDIYGIYSILLCFYSNFFFDLEDNIFLGKEWISIRVPSKSVKNLKFTTVKVSDYILDVIKLMTNENIRVYGDIINKIYIIKENLEKKPVDWDYTKKVKESLSKAFLEDNFHKFVSFFLPRKKRKLTIYQQTRKNLESLIKYWRLERMNLSSEDLNTIKSVGNLIATVSLKNVGLLFKIDKTKSESDFWGRLREISRKLVGIDEKYQGTIKPSSLDSLIQMIKIKKMDWSEIKDLLIIYSCMYYSIKNIGAESQNE